MLLREFVHFCDNELSEKSNHIELREQGLDIVASVEKIVQKYPTSRVFQNRSAIAALLHFSVHRLHVVAFADTKNMVHEMKVN